MNKNEFISELRKRLVGLPKEELENRIEFYEEAIADRIADGKSEEEAVDDIGPVDEVVREIAKDTPMVSLVKEKIAPKRSLRAWEIVLIILGFPLWLPLLIVAFVLILVCYILIWTLVIVTYVVEFALSVSAIALFVAFIAYVLSGELNLLYLGASIMAFGGAVLFFFACMAATKGTIKLSKAIAIGIKTRFIQKGGKKHE